MSFQETQASAPFGSAMAAPVAKAVDMAPVGKGDKHIWGIYIFLCIISVIELYSASSREVAHAGMGVYGTIVRHGLQLLLGFGIIFFLKNVHYKRFYKWIVWFTVISLMAMIYTFFFGDIINGARRSFNAGFFTVQPSELLKISAAMMLALIMSRTQVKGGGISNNGVILAAALILVFCGLLAPQGLTNTLLLMSISMSMMIVGGIKLKKLGLVLLAYGLCFGAYLGFQSVLKSSSSEPTEQAEAIGEQTESGSRISVWEDRIGSFFGNSVPKYDQPMTSKNRQEQLGYMAQAHGGVFGVMPGNSRETSRLPLAFTDYIYSIIVEEMGMIGGLFVLILYLWLLARASVIASKCVRAFPALLVIGMALVIVFQALFHICIVTGVIPVSGQPLPLISKGGCSIVVTSIAFGVMLSVSRFAVRNTAKKKEINLEKDYLPEEMRADNPTQL